MEPPTGRAETALADRISHLHARGRPRVWSLVVTIFGDAIVPRGGRVPLSVLQDVMGGLGIEAGALRTAMSRLAADGWVKREREGRNSFFRLAEGGRHAFDLATRRIYAGGPPQWDGGWTVAVAPPKTKDVATELSAAGFMTLSDTVFLRPHTGEALSGNAVLDGMLVIHGTSADHPEALRELWPSHDVAKAYHAFSRDWSDMRDALADGARPGPSDAMAARTLLVHDWRRIVLRDPGLPAALLPEDWPGEKARTAMRTIYAGLVRDSETWLDAAGMPPTGDRKTFESRFSHPAGA